MPSLGLGLVKSLFVSAKIAFPLICDKGLRTWGRPLGAAPGSLGFLACLIVVDNGEFNQSHRFILEIFV